MYIASVSVHLQLYFFVVLLELVSTIIMIHHEYGREIRAIALKILTLLLKTPGEIDESR